MGILRRCKFSSNIFQGFECIVDISSCQSLEDIAEIAKNELIVVLSDFSFENLLEKAKKTIFHIHSLSGLEYVLSCCPFEIIWICDHVSQ